MTKTSSPGTSTEVVPPEIVTHIEGLWITRCKTGGILLKGVRYQTAECEFFAGALAGLFATHPEYQTPMRWYVNALRGDRIVPLDRFK